MEFLRDSRSAVTGDPQGDLRTFAGEIAKTCVLQKGNVKGLPIV